MRLDERLQVIHGEYKDMCDGEKPDNTGKFDKKKLIVESIVVTDGVIYIQTEKQSFSPNDLNEKRAKKHVEGCGVLPNIFDGC